MEDFLSKDLTLSDISRDNSSSESHIGQVPKKRKRIPSDTSDDEQKNDKQKGKCGKVATAPAKKDDAKNEAAKPKPDNPPPKKRRGRPKGKATVKSLDERIHDLLSEWLAQKQVQSGNDNNSIGFIPVFFR